MLARVLAASLLVLLALVAYLVLAPRDPGPRASPRPPAPSAERAAGEVVPVDVTPASAPGRTEVEASLAVTVSDADAAAPDELAPTERLVFWGRLVDVESGAPIVGAQPEFRELARTGGRGGREVEGPRASSSDGQGYFEIVSEHASRSVMGVAPAGYGEVVFEVAEGHATRAAAQVLRLARSASWTVTVLDALDAPIAGATVALAAPGYALSRPEGHYVYGSREGIAARARTDAQGRCRFEDLPSEVALAVTVAPPGGEARSERDELALAPGEAREDTLRLGTGALVVGTVRDEGGAPVEGVEIWLQEAIHGGGEAGELRYLGGWRQRYVTQETASDGAGRFELEDVAEGSWWLGLAPPPLDSSALRQLLRGGELEHHVPLAVALEVRSADRRLEVELTARRGAFISGLVRAPDGHPAPRARVFARGAVLGALPAFTDGARFLVGPVAPGEYTLEAVDPRGRQHSAEVVARSGARDVELQLEEGGTLRGSIFDGGSGQSAAGAIVLWSPDPLDYLSMGFVNDGRSTFDHDGLEAGTYDVTARTRDGRVGILRGVEVRLGETTEGLLLEVHPGARLRVRYRGPATFANYRVYAGDTVVAANGLHTGTSELETVPAGRLRVELDAGRHGQHAREVVLPAGDEGVVAFELP